MNIAIVDDVPAETAEFVNAVKEYGGLNRIGTHISCFGSAEEFLADFAPLKYTFIVMDIYLSGADASAHSPVIRAKNNESAASNGRIGSGGSPQTGLEAVKKIRALDKNALIVFMSSSDEHYPDVLRLHAFDFLQKPPSKERIFELLDDITEKTTEVAVNLEFVCGKETIRLPYDRIAAVTASGHYSEVTDDDNNVYKTRMPYSAVCDILSSDSRFLEINRGTTVNLDMIKTIDDKNVCNLKNGTALPVNVKKCRDIINTWQNYMFAVLRNETIRRK